MQSQTNVLLGDTLSHRALGQMFSPSVSAKVAGAGWFALVFLWNQHKLWLGFVCQGLTSLMAVVSNVPLLKPDSVLP